MRGNQVVFKVALLIGVAIIFGLATQFFGLLH